jgi:uncharacterized protein YyaL (SSP411 family)
MIKPTEIIPITLSDIFRIRLKTKSNKEHIAAAVDWLKRAQDISGDGGVAAWYSLISGWAPSYIETTGYIINTFLDCSEYLQDNSLKDRAITMGNFLVKMQHSSGGYRTHVPSVRKISPPTVFNTGQDLLGMTALYKTTKNKKYKLSAEKAADFLCSIQEKDGSWLKNTYGNTTHAYHSRVAWGLLETYDISKNKKYRDAATAFLNWALQFQQPNGWFANAHLPPPHSVIPFTHTISYTIEGFLWSGLLLEKKRYIRAAEKAAKAMLRYYVRHDYLPGSLDEKWRSDNRYSCITGDAQIALVWGKLLRAYQ